MSEIEPTITTEQVRAWQRQQAQAAEAARRQLIADLRALAAERGHQIIAMPIFTEDGRIVADWAVTPLPS